MTTLTTLPLRTALAAGLLALPLAAAAADATATTDATLSALQHTRWTQENGGPPLVSAMAQTSDGWLWLNTADGLYRFDGQRFERFVLPGKPSLTRTRILTLAAHGRDLYVMYLGRGLSVLHPDGRFEDLTALAGSPMRAVLSLAVDADGSVWTAGKEIQRFAKGRWTSVLSSPEWRVAERSSMLLDAAGRLWAANEYGAWRLDRARGGFDKVASQGGSLLLAPDGGVWLADDSGGPVIRLAAGATAASVAVTTAADVPRANAWSQTAGAFDADGTLWALDCPERLCLVPGAAGLPAGAVLAPRRAAAERMAPSYPLSGNEPRLAMRDREGDIWIATEQGLDRFRARRVRASGLPGSGDNYSLAADGAGRLWAADKLTGTLWRLAPGRAPEPQPGPWTNVVAAGADGAVLIGGKRAIRRIRPGGGVDEIALPSGTGGKPADVRLLGILDDGRHTWTMSPETGLLAWDGRQWLPRSAFKLPQYIYLAVSGGGGRLWLATMEGQLVLYDGGKLTRYDMGMLGNGSGIFPGEHVTVGGERGLAVLAGGRLHLLRADEPDVLRNVSGIAVDGAGDRWLNGAAGIVHVRAADWRRAMADPDTPLRYELFDALDGYPGQAALGARLPTAFSADGRHLWLAAGGGVAMLDTAALRRNPVAPQPAILDVATDAGNAGTYGADGEVRLPAGTGSFRVRFTAPMLRKPEGVRFQYRLDGVDTRWQEAGTRRMTSYANVAPGDYVFRVRAFNEDGVASRADATLALHVAPTLVQSLPFRIACALGLAALAYGLHRYRVRQLTRRLTERLQVRTAERERIARTLHDTILQAVQVLMLRLDTLASSLPPGERARGELRRALDDAGDAIATGREQVRELRAGAATLEEAIEDCAQELAGIYPGIAFALRVEGRARPLHPAVVEEAAGIACEALRNAHAHAGARRIEATIGYGRRTLDVVVRDDGRGLDAEVARTGYRSGHWGLIGMRERAERIGARLALDSPPAGGTAVALAVPAARAYAG